MQRDQSAAHPHCELEQNENEIKDTERALKSQQNEALCDARGEVRSSGPQRYIRSTLTTVASLGTTSLQCHDAVLFYLVMEAKNARFIPR
jgi:hypothetical protein